MMAEPCPPAIVIGAGGHARVLLQTMRQCGQKVLFVTDDNPRAHGQDILDIRVIGTQDEVYQYKPEQVVLINAVGSTSPPLARSQVYHRFTTRGYRFLSVIHPGAQISPGARIAHGVQVLAGAVIQEGVVVGANTIINSQATIDHDCAIGAHCHIAPGVTVCGGVSISQVCHVGAGATVIQGRSIGYQSMIAAGAVVIDDIPSHSIVRGVPARP